MATKKKLSKKKAGKKKVRRERTAKKTGNKDARTKAVDRNDSAKKRVARNRNAAIKSRDFAAAGLAVQLTETLLDEIRCLDKPWSKTPEAQQAVVIARVSDAVANAASQAIQIVSAIGHQAVICNLFSVTFKDGVRAVITVAPGSDMRHALADHATRDVCLVLADPGVFMQGLADIKPNADQPKLI